MMLTKTARRAAARMQGGHLERKQKGQAAEDRFRAWLDRCCLPHIYVEQSVTTIPQPLRGEIKRPDFLVGIPTIGTTAVDVKAKRVYASTLLIDAYEHRTLLNFETSSTSRSGSPASRRTSRTPATCSSTGRWPGWHPKTSKASRSSPCHSA